eukprot:TRINITY_DN1597_c0_g1_i4.p1 TRINITY_DN1597_c0_g1~~TRINITY_DN1597_c0_g1_i4.p1  ORF type:complete len:206 (+),score=55.15 TRINITY_DN1597_c0_g1_i4:36-653(+)
MRYRYVVEKVLWCCFFFFFQAEDGIRDAQESRGLGDVYKRQVFNTCVFLCVRVSLACYRNISIRRRGGLLGEDAEEGILVVEEELLTLDLDGVSSEVGEEDGVALLDGGGPVLAGDSDGHDGSLVDLTGDLLGDEDTSLGLLGGLGALDEHALAEGLELLEGGGGEAEHGCCLLYTSDAADEEDSVDLGGRRIIKKKKKIEQEYK